MKPESPEDEEVEAFVTSLLKAQAAFKEFTDEDWQKLSDETKPLMVPLVLPLWKWSVQKVIDHAVGMANKRHRLIMAGLEGKPLPDEQKEALMHLWKTHAFLVFSNSMFKSPWDGLKNVTGLLLVAALYAGVNFFHPLSLMAPMALVFFYWGLTEFLEGYAYWRFKQVTGITNPVFSIKHSVSSGLVSWVMAALNLSFVLRSW